MTTAIALRVKAFLCGGALADEPPSRLGDVLGVDPGCVQELVGLA
jgi:hypothetical protein